MARTCGRKQQNEKKQLSRSGATAFEEVECYRVVDEEQRQDTAGHDVVDACLGVGQEETADGFVVWVVWRDRKMRKMVRAPCTHNDHDGDAYLDGTTPTDEDDAERPKEIEVFFNGQRPEVPGGPG